MGGNRGESRLRIKLLVGGSVADRCGSYQDGARRQVALEHRIALMLPRDFDHPVTKGGRTVDFNHGVRRQGSYYARLVRFVRPTQADGNERCDNSVPLHGIPRITCVSILRMAHKECK